ncbi:MAG TPA: hypothetical protein VG917_03310 [Patescibacteria group bacterium]|nr:hypothetical protein [Patescibacteria group bacterium]
MSIALTGKKKEQAEKFYDKLIKTLVHHKLPFMVGGTFAFAQYTGIERETGDIDIKIPFEHYPKVLKVLTEAGYKVELAEIELNWLAKVTDPNGYYTDLIYSERNGLHKVEESWLKRAVDGEVLGHKVKLEPVEEMIRSKSYVQNRHRHDGGDVIHLILKQGTNMDWDLLYEKMEPHWELLMGHILTFIFVYPSERSVIPKRIIEKLVANLEDRISHKSTKNKITRGLLLSNDYQVGVSLWGFTPITELK